MNIGENAKRNYLIGLIDILPVERRRHGSYDNSASSRRQATVSYTVPDGSGSMKKVCKKTFLNIFGISPQKITLLVKLKKEGQVIYKEKRGGAKNLKYTMNDRIQIRDHINSFPKEESHYGRKQNEKEYLSPDLNVSRLFTAFKIKYPESKVEQKFYRKVFLKDFPFLSFKKPRVDTCKTCDLLNMKSKSGLNQDSREAKLKLELHQKKASKAFETMKNDAISSTRPGSTTVNIVMDLQKVFPIPKLTHSNMYYSRQLSCYNFGIHISNTADGIMCVWHEGQSGRGGNQMASCLFQAINSGLLSSEKKHLVVWSDNCAGQLKNRMLVFLYKYLVAIGMFETIEHKFLVTGHSFSSADRDFAVIEKRAKHCTQMESVEDVMNVIATSRLNKPFKVVNMGEKFFNFDLAGEKFIVTKKLGISSLSMIKICKEEPNCVLFKKTFFGDWQKCHILKKGIKIEDFTTMTVEALPVSVPISENKKKDLREMLDYISEPNRAFYADLCT